jgi:hypothetical protein
MWTVLEGDVKCFGGRCGEALGVCFGFSGDILEAGGGCFGSVGRWAGGR